MPSWTAPRIPSTPALVCSDKPAGSNIRRPGVKFSFGLPPDGCIQLGGCGLSADFAPHVLGGRNILSSELLSDDVRFMDSQSPSSYQCRPLCNSSKRYTHTSTSEMSRQQ